MLQSPPDHSSKKNPTNTLLYNDKEPELKNVKAPDEVLRVHDQYYVLATSLLADQDNRVLKQGETFAIFDAYGDVNPVTHSDSGVYHRGTRYISQMEFGCFGGQRPLLLNSTLRDDNGLLKVDMTNRDLNDPETGFVAKGTIYFHREKFLLDACCMERVEITNYGSRDVTIDMQFRFGADFIDIFEVRGMKRTARGEITGIKRVGDEMRVEYLGLDRVRRTTVLRIQGLEFESVIERETEIAKCVVKVPAREKIQFTIAFSFFEQSASDSETNFDQGLEKIASDHAAGKQKYCSVRTSNEQFNAWMRRSTDDLVMMTTETDEGELYPYAGIPWFCAPFGRDGILTALECLWANPSLAKGVLSYLAKTQSSGVEPERDATPGKIIHEVRNGEMANLKEIPFGLYYGSVDSTPLFVGLAGLYYTRTQDTETVRALWPAIEKALEWIDEYGDPDKDGYIEYQRENSNGLIHQGWKDSGDSVFHIDNRDALAPIALAEAQGYAYLAKIEGAKLAELNSRPELAAKLRVDAERLKENFDRDFWIEDLGTYALALDGEKKPCRVKTSNAGQCLFTGIVKESRAKRLAQTLMSPESFSGWGVRTLASDSVRYNPMSYHNGSVWPHDVALVALGLARYGFKEEVERIFNGLFRAATYMELMRMPEVFCGFPRREGEAPTLYPHSCSPQAWAAASVYCVVQAMLGLEIDVEKQTLFMRQPRLPESIETLKISGLIVGDRAVDLVVQNYFNDVSIQVARRGTGVHVVVEK